MFRSTVRDRRYRKLNLGAFTAPDPVPLQGLKRERPIQLLESPKQAISECSNPQHPLPHRPSHNSEPADLTLAIDHFFVREHGAEFRAPIDRHFRDVSEPDAIGIVALIGRDWLGPFRLRVEPRIVDPEKNPLRPFVVSRIGGVDLALPIVGKSNSFQLRLELADIFAGRDRRMLSRPDGILLCWQTERVPAHWVKDVESVQPLEPGDDVGGGVTFRVTHVEPGAARVGEHVEDIELWLVRVEPRLARIRRMKGRRLIPDGLPFRLNVIEWIGFATLVHAKD